MAVSKKTKSGTVATAQAKKTVASVVGAPSQRGQTTRKGKKAWRKNVDLDDVEQGMEGLRAEERVTGSTLQKKQNDELFQIDVEGDAKLRKALPKFSRADLSSSKILAARSAVPAVFSRPTAPSRKDRLSREDKARLLRTAKRVQRGPFNSIMDPSEYAAGSSTMDISEAAKAAGAYDAWEMDVEPEDVEGIEGMVVRKIKPPTFPHPRDVIEVPAIVEPHQGTSYNPTLAAHKELLAQAHDIEVARLKEQTRLAEEKAKMESMRTLGGAVYIPGLPAGMTLDEIKDEGDEDEALAPKKLAPRKTQAQRNKAARLLKERHILAEKAAKKRMLATINTSKAMKKEADQTLKAREQVRMERALAMAAKAKLGFAGGQKLGRHKVPERDVDVQLGEDLSESLRGLKPEGNLFRDRFQSLQQRALIEPRVPVLPTKRLNKLKEYEKHAWKNFERER